MQRLVKTLTRALVPVSKPRPQAVNAAVPNKTTTASSRRSLTTTGSTMGSVTPTTTTAPAKAATSPALSADTFLDLIKNRRTYYPLNKDLTIPPSRVREIVGEALQHVPSSFNSQSNRAVALFGAEHERFWDITTDILRAIVPADAWESTGQKMAMFRAAAGTVLFFEDQQVVEKLQADWPLYADKFPGFAAHSSGMLHFAVWTALEAEGLGANLQHYNPLVDAKVAETWGVPTTWRLTAQLVFGGRAVADPGPKTFAPLEDKFKVFGA